MKWKEVINAWASDLEPTGFSLCSSFLYECSTCGSHTFPFLYFSSDPQVPQPIFLSFSPQHLRILRSFSKILGSCGKRKEEKERRIAKLILELKQIPVTYEGISFANHMSHPPFRLQLLGSRILSWEPNSGWKAWIALESEGCSTRWTLWTQGQIPEAIWWNRRF